MFPNFKPNIFSNPFLLNLISKMTTTVLMYLAQGGKNGENINAKR